MSAAVLGPNAPYRPTPTRAQLVPSASYAGDLSTRPTSPPTNVVNVATYLPSSRPGSGLPGTIVQGKVMPPSASLPVIIKADLVTLGVGSPAPIKKVTPEEEISQLRRRLRALEVELKKTHASLAREQERAEHGTTKQDLERQVAVWNRAKEQWEREHAAELQRVKEECNSRLESSSRDWDKRLRSTAGDMNATAEARLEALKADMDARAEQEAERAKEERIELLRRQSARRMMNAGLTGAWSAWFELWEAKTYAINRLREVANHLRKPEMSLAFSYFVRNRETATKMALARSAMKKEASLLSVRTELEEEIVRLTAEYEKRLAMAEESKKIALEHLRVELLGSTAQQAELRAAKEKEERVEHLRKQSMRRIANKDIAAGWIAWFELWEAKSYALRRLREVGNKLRSPELSYGFGLWAGAWRVTQARKAAAAAQKNDALLFAAHRRCEEMEAELARMAAEVQAGVDERAGLRSRIAELDGGAEEAERLHAEHLAREKEERVEMLRKQAMRRVLNSGLTSGFAAWVELAEARVYALERLRQVGNRLRLPHLAMCFEFWGSESLEAKLEAEKIAWKHKEQHITGKAAALGAELVRVRAECEAKLAHAAREHDAQLQRLKLEMSGDNDEQRAAAEAADKEARVELLRRQIGRRILNQAATRGWTAWHEFYVAKASAMRTLRRVAAKLKRPEVAYAFDVWLEEILEQRRQVAAIKKRQKAAKLEDEVSSLREQLRTQGEEASAKLAASEAERAQLLLQVTQLGGGAAEAAALREAQAEKDKEERVELCRRQSMRRMLNRGLSNGFEAWRELVDAKAYALARLKAAANRLKSPEVAEAFGVWAEVWAERRQNAAMTTFKQQAEQLAVDRDKVIAELHRVSADYEAKLVAAEEAKRMALHRQRVELCGSAEEIAALRDEKDKDARVEMLRRQVTRRIMNSGLSSAWTSWLELWQAKSYALRRLREVGNKLRSPELSSAFGFWQGDSSEAKRTKEMKRLEREANSLEAQVRRARYEAGQLDLLRVAHEDEIRALKERNKDLSDECKTNEAELAAAAEMRLKYNAVVQAMERAKEAAATAERLRLEAEEDALEHRLNSQALLERLLAEQRATFDSEREQLMVAHGMGAEFRASVEQTYDEERARVKEEMTTLVRDLQQSRDDAARGQRELQTSREEVSRLEGLLGASKLNLVRLEKDLKEERAKPKAPKPSPPKEKPPKQKMGSSALGKIDLDEGPDAPPITEQIAAALRKNAGKVMDLFREWDADGDGEVSKKEFRKAMPAIGLEVPVKEVDALFDSWDKDGGGSLNYKELSKILRSQAGTLNSQAAQKKVEVASATVTAVSKFKKSAAKPPAVVTPSP